MNAQNYTQKSLEALNTAKSMAEENRNSAIAPEHLLYALVDQDGGPRSPRCPRSAPGRRSISRRRPTAR